MIRTMLAALDDTPRASGVFDAAAGLAERFGADLFVLRVIDVPPEFPAAGAGTPRDALPEFLSRAALEELGSITARHPSVAAKAIVRAGAPWRAILDVAEDVGADLIVMGSHGYSGLDHVFGTTEGKIVNRSPRSVYLVHGSEWSSAGTKKG
jgi:nucleotide-binding universal stress UspA family protein